MRFSGRPGARGSRAGGLGSATLALRIPNETEGHKGFSPKDSVRLKLPIYMVGASAEAT